MKKYIFTSALLFTLFSGNGQIVYQSVSEIYPNSGNREFDVDNNGQMDFRISFSTNTANFIGLNGTEFVSDGSGVLMGYNSGIQLGGNTYEPDALINASNPYFPLTVPDETLKYAGFRFKINGTYRCGYILVGKILISGTTYLKCHSYAYEQDPSKCITTGAMPSSVGLHTQESNEVITVSPNPSNDIFQVNLGDNYSLVATKVTDLSGREIAFSSEQQKQFLFISIQESPGVYLLTVESAGQQEVIRLIKK